MSIETSCHIGHLLQVSKKSLWNLILYNFFFFHDFKHVFSPDAGADNPLGTKFWSQQKHLVTWVFWCKFKKNLFEVWFYTIVFMILYMYIAPGQGQTAPRGQSFDFNKNVLSLHSFVASFKKCLWSLIVYIFFHDLEHAYSPGARADSPQGTKFWCQQKGLITLPICCKFQRNLFEVWFIHFFHDLTHVYSPGAGGIQPLGDKILMSTETSCHFGHLLRVSNHRLQ